MSNIYFVVAITEREMEETFDQCLRRLGLTVVFSSLGHGTGQPGLLDLLGLDKTEKSVLFALAERNMASRALRVLTDYIGLNSPGRGIAVTIPVSSVDRQLACHLTGEMPIVRQEECLMDMTHELIVAIVDKGKSDLVMDAAREADAPGGTILHAKGTDAGNTRKFFGISLADEKEIVLIVVPRELKAGVMRAIAHDAGASSEAQTILFSLPVSEAAGLHDMQDDPDE